VLATLGYSPASRPLARTVGGVLVLAGLVAAGWVLWRIYSPREIESLAEASGRRAAATPGQISRAPNPVPETPVGRAQIPVPEAPAAQSQTPALDSQVSRGLPPSHNASTPPQRSEAASQRVFVPPAPRPPAPSPVTRTEPATSGPPPARPAPQAEDLDLALYYHRAGDFESALVHYRAILQKNELNAPVHNNLGLLYQEKNLLGDSARELQRAVLISPRYARAHNNYGVTLLREGNLDAAAAEFRTVLTLEPRNVDAMINLALVEKALGQLDRAKESLLRALTAAPQSAAAHYNLAVLYDDANDSLRAIEHYRAFLETAGAEYASRAPDVRARLTVLTKAR
jgi:Tfp pilus assembly protein PilF